MYSLVRYCQFKFTSTTIAYELIKPQYYRHRFLAEMIRRYVWLYFRFRLSCRNVEEMMVKLGVAGSYETIRDGTIKFSGLYAKRLQLKAQRPCDCWHLNGEVLDMFLIFFGLNATWRVLKS